MPKKIFRTKAQRTASRRDPKRQEGPKDKESHPWPIFLLGSAFLILGAAEAINPIPYHSGGGYAKGAGAPSIIYSRSQSAGMGVFFALIGLVFLYFGYCIVRGARKR